MVTATSAAPAAPAGVVALISVSETTVKLAAGVPPKLTAVALVKLVPVMVTVSPPSVDPLVGAMLAIVGGGAFTVKVSLAGGLCFYITLLWSFCKWGPLPLKFFSFPGYSSYCAGHFPAFAMIR